MNQDVKYWLDLSQYDIDTAKAMFKSGRYLYVLFTSQQAVEKILKAIIVLKTKKFPPRIHDLIKLVNLAEVKLDIEQKQFLAKLNFYYLETRYPEQIIDLSKDISNDMAKVYLEKSEEILNWLKTKIV